MSQEPALSSRGTPPLRGWMVLFILSWLPLVLGMITRVQFAARTPWWHNIYSLAPRAAALRAYWFVSTPIIGLGLIAAAILLLARRPSAALVTALVLLGAVVINTGELAIVTLVNYDFTAAISNGMHIPREDVAGLQPGIQASLGSLIYTMSCLGFLFFGRRVQDDFGPVTVKRLCGWIGSIVSGEESDEERPSN